MYKGQGDGDTKWKGWSWKLLLISWEIIYIYINVYREILVNV